MLIKMFLYARPENWLKKCIFRRYALHKSKCEESTKCCQKLISKIYDAQVFWKLSEGFRKSFLDKRAWNVTKRRTLPPAFPIFGYFWEWMTFDSFFWQGRLLLMYFDFSPKSFLSAVSFVMQHEMLIKNFCSSPVRTHSL